MLYSTKRKWDKLLHPAASKQSPPSPAATASAPLSPQIPSSPSADPKKARTEARTAGSGRPSVRAVSPADSLYSTTTVSALSRSAHATYSPWDRDAFLARLASFRFVDKWSAKPAAVNEVAWARRGWVCVDKDRVRCAMCRKEVLVKVDGDDERAVVDRYEDMVVDEHDESCLWRKRGCDGASPPAPPRRRRVLTRDRHHLPAAAVGG